jgi:hypothetical protein
MLVPELLYGIFRDVKRDCNKLIKHIVAGESWERTVGSLPLIDLQQKEGLIFLDGTPSCFKGQLSYHSYLLLYEARLGNHSDLLTHSMEDVMFLNALKTCWGTLSLIGIANQGWLRQHRSFSFDEWRIKRYEPFLEACVNYWDELSTLDHRYDTAFQKGLWNEHTTLKYVLANMGVPTDILRASLPSEGLPKLVALAHEKVAAGWQGLNQQDVN